MKYAFAAVALAALARAQGLADIPTCAQPCLESAIKDNTSCEVSDLACVCKNFDSLQGDAQSCVLEKCGAEKALNEVLPAASKLCENPPSGGSSGSSSSAAAESSAAPETSAAPESSAAPEPTPVPLPSPESTVAPGTSKPAETETKVVAPPADETGSEPTPVPTAGAAMVGSMGTLAMVVLGALAL